MHVQAVTHTPSQERADTPTSNQRWKFLDEGKLRKVSGRLFSTDPASGLRYRAPLPGIWSMCVCLCVIGGR